MYEESVRRKINIDDRERRIKAKQRDEKYRKLYLGEIVDKEKPEFENSNLILAPVGSGKSFLIENKLIPKDYKGTVLYLTSNTALKDSLAPDDNSLRKEFADKGVSINFFTSGNKERFGNAPYSVHVMTYHEFGIKVSNPNETFTKDKNLIFCDEIHSLPIFSQYGGSGKLINPLSAAILWLFRKHKDKRIYYFTATRAGLDNLESRIPGCLDNVKEFDYINHPDIRKYEAKSTYYVSNTYQLRMHLKAKVDYIKRHGHKGLAFTRYIEGQERLAKVAEEEGYTPIVLWSINSKDPKMTKEQINVRDELLRTGYIPEPYNFLIINGAMQEGWNLFDDKVEFSVLDTMDETEKAQALGRIRKDVDFIILKTDSADHRAHHVILKDKYIGVPLTTDDKEMLIEELGIENDRNELMKWPTLKKIINNSGYIVEDKTITIDSKRTRVSLIKDDLSV